MTIQSISPRRNLFFAGDTVRFTLSGVPAHLSGRAVVRTNIGNASRRRTELIEHTELNRPLRNSDWHDIEMLPGEEPGEFTITLPLCEVGIFEAKCCFLPDGDRPALWAAGENFHLKVESAVNAAGNSIYCAFVRQWNDIMHLPCSPALPDLKEYDDKNFIIVPPSGTFRKLKQHLDHIFDTLNCRILQLLPIHPTPVSYGRMGRYGSPFAATDYFAVDPALAEFDESATPMEQFEELIDAIHSKQGRIFMDIPVNHTGWASKLQCEHPDYFVRRAQDDKFESPGAWGIIWKDLCKLDYGKTKVHELMAKVFLFWCKRGVDGFRCDAGYMVPEQAWNYITARVRREYPDTVFLLEGLGGPLSVQEKLLNSSGLNWGYSELFQNYSRDEISRYYPYMNDIGNRMGTLANFAETHDNDRLAVRGKVFARNRFLVTALLSQHGTFGFANGAEFFASEKIDVHGCGTLNFGSPDNLNALIGKLNTLLAHHPAFGVGVDVKLIQRGDGNYIAALRSGKDVPPLLVLINLECGKAAKISFPSIGFDSGTDLLSGKKISFQLEDNTCSCMVDAGDAMCISFDGFTLPSSSNGSHLPESAARQCAAAMAQKAALQFMALAQSAAVSATGMCIDPVQFTENISGISPAPVTIFRYPQDCKRKLMLPPGDLLLVKSKDAFIMEIIDNKMTINHTTAVALADKTGFFALVSLPENPASFPRDLQLKLTVFEAVHPRRAAGTLHLLPSGVQRQLRLANKSDTLKHHLAFGSNDRGGYAMFSADWGKLHSKYDALLAANINRNFPQDRYVMFSCCRAWLVIDGYSLELNSTTLEEYTAHPGNRATFSFSLPDGHGGTLKLTVDFAMSATDDKIFLRFKLPHVPGKTQICAKLILRPELEDRINHTTTRACDGAEHLFRRSIRTKSNGFDFHPSERQLSIELDKGVFCFAPEWRYMVDLPAERYCGLPDKTDLFSPGYFTAAISSGESVILSAAAGLAADGVTAQPPSPEESEKIFSPLQPTLPPAQLAIPALSRFVVKRDALGSVIAGYPWFLDWGRDTLIALRGLVQFPEFRQNAAQILLRFAAFEKNGTLPNMICGGNDSNRDTSDAPLYLITAVRDYIAVTGDENFLNTICNGRTLYEILNSIIHHYQHGTPNSIKMDEKSKLIFSPAHFSWMDTNYPAGTPREGYPVEIQALWYAALKFMGEEELAASAADSIRRFYFSEGRFSDCLHCVPGTPAEQAVPDDHIRCNMLTAITSGAIRDKKLALKILEKSAFLLVPGAIRTLDDADTDYPLPVEHNGRLLNDPHHPYCGKYCGREDEERKPAYHNGTAWCWPFPSYCEALYLAGGEKSRKRALALLLSAVELFEQGIPGELPEVLDGDAPHRPGGCPAQAWSVSEFFRVLELLSHKIQPTAAPRGQSYGQIGGRPLSHGQ